MESVPSRDQQRWDRYGAGKDVLELGCGYGRLSVFLAKQGARVTGIDIGANLVAAAREPAEINGAQVRFDRGDISELPYPSETHRLLRPGGIAAFTESVEDSPALVRSVK